MLVNQQGCHLLLQRENKIECSGLHLITTDQFIISISTTSGCKHLHSMKTKCCLIYSLWKNAKKNWPHTLHNNELLPLGFARAIWLPSSILLQGQGSSAPDAATASKLSCNKQTNKQNWNNISTESKITVKYTLKDSRKSWRNSCGSRQSLWKKSYSETPYL